MKKVIALVLTITIAMTFFCSVVFGADYQTYAIQTGTSTVDGVIISTQIIELYSHIDSQPIYDGSAYVPFLYTTTIYNTTDTDKLVIGAKVAARYQNLGTRYLSNIDNMSPDLTMSISTMAGTGWFDILPSSTFSVENGILVPAHRSLYAVSVVYMECDYIYNNVSQDYRPVMPAFEGDAYTRLTSVLDGSGYSFFDPSSGGTGTIDASTLNSALQTYIGDPSNGDLIDYLNTVSSGIGSTNTYLDVIVARLNTIISNMNAWSGTIPSYAPWPSYQTSATVSMPFGTEWCTLYSTPSFEYSEDFEKLTNSTSYFNYTTVIPCQITYYFKSDYDHDLDVSDYFTITGVAKQNNGYSIVGGELRSNFASVVRWNAYNNEYNLQIFPDVDKVYKGDQFVLTYDFYIVYSVTSGWVYWQTGTLAVNSMVSGTYDTEDNIQEQSQSIKDTTNAIHQQESQWFAQNGQALQSVGLSNYNFGSDASSGIGGVTNDFTDLFNSLGKWNAIYIFSMTLTVALTIIRYQVVSSKKKK